MEVFKVIKEIINSDLVACLEIFHRGYETVAIQFGLTEGNCPDRGRASLPFEKLVAEFEDSTLMYGYFLKDKIVGFINVGFKKFEKAPFTVGYMERLL